MTVLNEEQLRNAISTLLLFFVARGKQVKRSDLHRAMQLAAEIATQRDSWLEAAGFEHREFLAGRDDLFPKTTYAALAGTVLGPLGVELPTIRAWATSVGCTICRLLSAVETEDFETRDYLELTEWYVYFNSSQTERPISFKDKRHGNDTREFFEKGFKGELEIVD